MMTVKEVSKLTGVSVRALHYYDKIGLLTPSVTTDAGYRLYDRASLERLEQILLFRALEFSLKEIREILDRPGFDRKRALSEQRRLLTLKKEHLEALIAHTEQLEASGGYAMNFEAFDQKKLETYKAEAKQQWGDTEAYREYGQKAYTAEEESALGAGLMSIFAELGREKEKSPADAAVQALVQKLRDYITANFYTCTKPILSGLGQMYAAGGEMTENIDAAGGAGTAEFAAKAIAHYCK